MAFGLSVVFILLLKEDRYYGYVYGTIVAMILLSVYLSNQISPFYVKCKIKKEHVRYILNYCLPYIPYTLSGVIIAQFGRIVMSDYGGFESAGIFSFMSNIAALMLIVISVVHSAWNPYYLRYMTDRDYTSIDKDYDIIFNYVPSFDSDKCLLIYNPAMLISLSLPFSTFYLSSSLCCLFLSYSVFTVSNHANM